jgi:hypothetical protein
LVPIAKKNYSIFSCIKTFYTFNTSLERNFFFRLSRGVEISAIFRYLGWIDEPHTQDFETMKSLEQTQESKYFKISS